MSSTVYRKNFKATFLILAIFVSLMMVSFTMFTTPADAATQWSLEGWRIDSDIWIKGNLFTYYEDNYVPIRLIAETFDATGQTIGIQHDYMDANGVIGIDCTSEFFIGPYKETIDVDDLYPGDYIPDIDGNPITDATPIDKIPHLYDPPTGFSVTGPTLVEVSNGWLIDYQLAPTGGPSFLDELEAYGEWAIYWEAHLSKTGGANCGFGGEVEAGSSYFTGQSLHTHTSVTGNQDVPIGTDPTFSTNTTTRFTSPTGATLPSPLELTAGESVIDNAIINYYIPPPAASYNGPYPTGNVQLWMATTSGGAQPDPYPSAIWALQQTVSVPNKYISGNLIPFAPITINAEGDYWFTVIYVPAGGSKFDGSESDPIEEHVYVECETNLAITKSADTECVDLGAVDHTITYTFNVTNSGAGLSPISNVAVTDDVMGTISGPASGDDGDGKLEAGETWIYTKDYTPTEAGTISNTATVTGADPCGNPLSEDSNTVDVDVYDVAVTITKEADTDCIDVGGTINYTYLVTNTGEGDLTNVVVTDSKGLTLTRETDQNGNDDNILNEDEIWEYSASYLTVPADDGTTISNTATVTADGPCIEDVNETSNQVDVDVYDVDVTIDKSADSIDCIPAGGTVNYTYLVENTGTGDLDNVTVTDDNGTPSDVLDDFSPAYESGDDGDGLLNSGEMWTYKATVILTATTTNTATVNADGPCTENATAMDSATVEVCALKCDTAWGYGNDAEDVKDFVCDLGLSNWGWSNRISQGSSYTFDLVASAGSGKDCSDPANGTVVGQVYVEYIGDTITAEYTVLAGNTLEDVHFWVGTTELPVNKNGKMNSAPGQFPEPDEETISGNSITIYVDVAEFEGSDLYVAAHAVVCYTPE